MKQSSQTIKALVIAVIIAGILGSITVLAMDSIGPEGAKIFAICIALIICGICGAICMVAAEKPTYKVLGGAGMIVALVLFLLVAVAIVAEVGDEGFLKFLGSLLIILLGLTHISLLHHFNLQNKYALYARITATIAISIFTLLSVVNIFDTLGGYYESFLFSPSGSKIIAVSLIVDLAATALVPLCNRLEVPENTEIHFDSPPAAEQPEKQDPVA